jgi:hypothetical protein
MDDMMLDLIYSERERSETREYLVVERGEWQGYRTRNEQREKLIIGCPKLGDGNL